MSTRRVPVIERIMGANDTQAADNRRIFDEHGVHVVNIMAAPGAGKTSLILETVRRLQGELRIGAIEGDVASTVDTDKVRAGGAPAVQINTGGGCHLDAKQVAQSLNEFPLDEVDLVFIENVGNLICPVGFALGEHTRVAISSVPEGDDKPYKYPKIYANVDALVINKIDLLPYLPFDLEAFQKLVRSLNPDIELFPVSCVTGEGMDAWTSWLQNLARAE
ncbi:MAG: hydrogenase nickel incorporation protein HypB [Chloroflexi bacterium]|mgnify:CR=1 FL=1|nr:hydrogenase nickel incorporation protein HypB [Chloroflexota bacterium]